MGVEKKCCPVCNSVALVESVGNEFRHIVECPSCGNFLEDFLQLHAIGEAPEDMDKLAAYLCYNGKISNPYNVPQKNFRNYICTKEYFGEINKGSNEIAWVTNQMVDAWYPRAFHEKVDMFLLVLSKTSAYLGAQVRFPKGILTSLTFSKRMEKPGVYHPAPVVETQCEYFLRYLLGQGYVSCDLFRNDSFMAKDPPLQLTAKGLQRVDELQKHLSENSKNVFVAMSFADEMKETRDAIKAAITNCGFNPRLMDEIEHNHQIVPEMLYEIRQARFVIAELTGHNNGAYFEAGYALGLGKDVIQVCRKDAFGQDGHFDVKQVSTILWDDYDDLTTRLQNRITATIN